MWPHRSIYRYFLAMNNIKHKPKNILNNSFLFYSLAPMFEVLLVFKAQLISRPLSATQCCHTAGLMTLPDVTLAPGATHCDTHCPTHI